MNGPRRLEDRQFVDWLDKSRLAAFAVLVVGGIFMFGDSVLIMRSAQLAMPELGVIAGQIEPRPVPTAQVITWWDIGRTFITLIALVALAVMMLRSRAVSIFKEEVDAQRVREDRLKREHEELVKTDAAKDAELAALRGRTDLTRVIEMQQELLLMKKEHDTAIVASIAQISARGDEHYASAMDTLTKTLNYLAEAARNEKTAVDSNRALLERVVKLAESNWHATSRIEQAVVEHAADADAEHRGEHRR